MSRDLRRLTRNQKGILGGIATACGVGTVTVSAWMMQVGQAVGGINADEYALEHFCRAAWDMWKSHPANVTSAEACGEACLTVCKEASSIVIENISKYALTSAGVGIFVTSVGVGLYGYKLYTGNQNNPDFESLLQHEDKNPDSTLCTYGC